MIRLLSAAFDHFLVVQMVLEDHLSAANDEGADAYAAILPLDDNGVMDERSWRACPGLCRVSHMDRDGLSSIGSVSLGQDGAWTLAFDGEESERALLLDDGCVLLGARVRVRDTAGDKVYRVVTFHPLGV